LTNQFLKAIIYKGTRGWGSSGFRDHGKMGLGASRETGGFMSTFVCKQILFLARVIAISVKKWFGCCFYMF
jgi:hypothetical protein